MQGTFANNIESISFCLSNEKSIREKWYTQKMITLPILPLGIY